MRLWIDECLSPLLVRRSSELGYEATCNRDRGLLGASDRGILEQVRHEDFVLVTNNEADFVSLFGATELHCGLIVLPTRTRAGQLRLLDKVITWINDRSAQVGERPADWMLNRAVEVDDATERVQDYPLPGSPAGLEGA